MVKGTRPVDGTYVQRDDGILQGIKECSINSFIYCYNNICRIYKDAKYGVSYWLQKPLLSKFRGTNKPAYRLDIKDNKFNKGEAFTNNKAIKVAYQKLLDNLYSLRCRTRARVTCMGHMHCKSLYRALGALGQNIDIN